MATSATVPFAPRHPRGVLTPIVKWVGGKRRLAPGLAARMPHSYARYFEPLAGGAALFLHVDPEHAVLADTNADLIAVYRDVAHRVDALIADLEWHAQRHSKDFYYGVRANWNSGFYDPPNTNRSAAFLYLNKTCFNGLWRVNDGGGFNVPMGRYDDPAILNAAALRAAAPAFGRADLRICDFRAVLAEARGGDFVYFDPPYIPTSRTASFTGYTSGGFSEADHRELAATARDLVARGVQVMVSNSDTPLTWELYGALPGFRIERVSRVGAINSDTSRRGPVTELLIMAGYPVQESAAG